MVEQVLKAFCQWLRVLIGILMICLSIPVGMQVISRYTGIIPTFLWTGELATFIFVWVIMIGSMVAVWEGTHFDVVVTRDASTPWSILFQKGIVHLFIAIFAILFTWYGIEFAKIGFIQKSLMMKANLIWIYISVPITGFVWAIFSIYRLFELIQTLRPTQGTEASS